ncbi:nitroreductase family protein [Ensifer sp. NPDC090286]|uniref:nitroreductase family protein n=1 Tax=Ensifer sp. NPDC090286 TaxID=3363991 RepID=UPI00383BECD8
MTGPYLTTSPFFFVTPAERRWKAVELSQNEGFKHLAREVFDAAAFFLDPKSRQEAELSGIMPEAIDAALENRILIPADDPSLPNMRLWEDRRWSRVAYLAFSQQNLRYLEPTEGDPLIHDLIEFRRSSISDYLDVSAYPPRHLVKAPLAIIELPPQPRRPDADLDALMRRRSVRSFSSEPVDLETFTRVLSEATHYVRVADASKRSGDPFFLLNSFYTWLEIYVVVQGVEGLRRGAYQYDMNGNRLLAIDWDIPDDHILTCIQHQNWIGGAGFCVFISVDWLRYLWVYRHARAYVNLVIQLGEIGQELLQAAYRYGLAGWPTPAVHESNCAKLLQLDDRRRDAMYFMKLGPAKTGILNGD